MQLIQLLFDFFEHVLANVDVFLFGVWMGLVVKDLSALIARRARNIER